MLSIVEILLLLPVDLVRLLLLRRGVLGVLQAPGGQWGRPSDMASRRLTRGWSNFLV